jgi:hypothetical protein
MYCSDNPGWLTLNVVAGGLTLNTGANIYGYVTISNGVLGINGNTFIVGGVAANQLLIKNKGKLCLGQSCN